MPNYTVINNQGNIKKMNRLQRELKSFKDELNQITFRSGKTLASLRELADKKFTKKD